MAGACNTHGQAQYWYPEITGYYLSWVARIARDARIAARLPQATIDLLARGVERCAAQAEPPVARIAAGVAQPDKYAHTRYFFDVAIYYRGVVEFDRAFPNTLPTDVRAHLDPWVSRFADAPGGLCATLGDASPGSSWSYRVGPHQAKATGHLLRLATGRPAWYQAVQTAHDRLAATIPGDAYPSHPLAYWYEGCLARGVMPAPAEQLTDRRVKDRGMPEAIGSSVYRIDALAQSLRLAIRAAAAGGNDSWPPICEDHAAQLAAAVQADGAVPFTLEQAGQGGNTWCAMFAWQALSMFEHWRQGRASEIDTPETWI